MHVQFGPAARDCENQDICRTDWRQKEPPLEAAEAPCSELRCPLLAIILLVLVVLPSRLTPLVLLVDSLLLVFLLIISFLVRAILVCHLGLLFNSRRKMMNIVMEVARQTFHAIRSQRSYASEHICEYPASFSESQYSQSPNLKLFLGGGARGQEHRYLLRRDRQ